MNPLINKGTLKRMESWVKGQKKGPRVIRLKCARRIKKRVCHSFNSNKEEMKVVFEEAFGPLAVMSKLKVLKKGFKGDKTRFGLQVGVYTDSVERMKCL